MRIEEEGKKDTIYEFYKNCIDRYKTKQNKIEKKNKIIKLSRKEKRKKIY